MLAMELLLLSSQLGRPRQLKALKQAYLKQLEQNLALQDMHKLMNKDKIILRFTARMTPGQSAVSHADAGELRTCAWQHWLLPC